MKDAKYTVVLIPDSSTPSVREPVLWCLEAFGPVGPRWDWKFTTSQPSYGQEWSFYFAEKSDCIQFTLAWV